MTSKQVVNLRSESTDFPDYANKEILSRIGNRCNLRIPFLISLLEPGIQP
jgi:hypothetical protein